MEQSANLQIPYIMPSQAQKHVTHNEAIRVLDALVQLSVVDRDLSTPPGSPAEGSRYLVATGGTGAWAGRDGMVAAWQDGAWAFLAPKAGWLLWIADEDRLIGFDGAAWIDAAVHSVNPAPLVGVNAIADAANRLAVKSPASLFDEETGDHRLKINKASAGDTASLVFQSGYSGRAEFGLAGDDDWHVKVSADGAAWTEALTIDRTSGRVRLPAALPLSDDNQVVARRHVRERLSANRIYYVRTDGSDGNNGLANTSGGAFLTIQKAVNAVSALDISVYDVSIQVAVGTYTGVVQVSGPWVGSGSVSIVGDTTTPSNVVISTTGNHAILVRDGGRLRVRGVKLQTTTSGHGIVADTNGIIRMDGAFEIGACATYHMLAQNGGSIVISASYTISGGALYHWNCVMSGLIDVIGLTISLTGTPAFSQRFAYASRSAAIQCHLNTFSGAATGSRYLADTAGGIFTNGAGTNYLPGNAAGIATAPGYYN